jgi:4-hydroxy-3-methylbut-2-enyl diphosphate reductase
MDVRIAEKAGFCFGVSRAIGMVEKALSGERPVYSLGPVIHNPQVIGRLRERGLQVVDNLEDAKDGVVVVRSHGAPLHTYQAVEERGFSIIDATCPFVKKMHHQARGLIREGYQLIIVGDGNHSEITSLTDDPGFRGIVVSRASELDGVKLSRRIGLISQTTQPMENFREVANRLLPVAGELKILNTICDSTITRQAEAREIAARVKTMVVIGGRNSANTRRLVEICQESGTRTVWVETAAEIDPEMFRDIESIGLTSGASTPEWIIKEVSDRLVSLREKDTIMALPSQQGGIPHNRR